MLKESMMGPQHGSPHRLTTWTLLTCAIAVVVVGMLLFASPDGSEHKTFLVRGPYFWQKVVWCEVLLCILWFGGFRVPSDQLSVQRQQTGGGTVVASAAITNACLWSALILFGSVFLPDDQQRWFVIAQVLIFVTCLVVVMSVGHARRLQNDGIAPIPADVKDPEQLVAQLTVHERRLIMSNPQLARAIKSIRERINYSLPRAGNISTSSRYLELTRQVDALCAILGSEGADTFPSAHIRELDDSVTRLVAELKC